MSDLETEMRALITGELAQRYRRQYGWEKWMLIGMVLLISGSVTLMLHDMLTEADTEHCIQQCAPGRLGDEFIASGERNRNGQDCRCLIENHRLPGDEKFGGRVPEGDDIFERLFGKSSPVTLSSGGTTIVPKSGVLQNCPNAHTGWPYDDCQVYDGSSRARSTR